MHTMNYSSQKIILTTAPLTECSREFILNTFSPLHFVCEQEEIHERPQITSMIGSLANYSNTIPAAPDAAEGDARPAQPAARMGKFIV